MNDGPAPLSAVSADELRAHLRVRADGRVTGVVGLLIEGICPAAAVGDMVEIHAQPTCAAEVVGLRAGSALMVGLGDTRGLSAGSTIRHQGVSAMVGCGDGLLGRVVDARGVPIDGKGPVSGPLQPRPIYASAPNPLSRPRIDTPIELGIRAIDGMLTLGQGQRIAILAGAGVGKSRLLGALAAGATADAIVLGLVGERGREVGEFLHGTLSPAAAARSVTVVATSDTSPLQRMRAAFVATTYAEHLAEQGQNVLLLMDSLTRFAMAGRELGLSLGEPPATRGYTPSVFAQLPKLLERAGRRKSGGSITGIYTVLVEGDDLADPIGDAVRSIVDGHIVLSRDLASMGHYPAIDVLASVSRTMDAVIDAGHLQLATRMRRLLANLKEAQELQAIGAYVPGAVPALDQALKRRDAVAAVLRQGQEATPMIQTIDAMKRLAGEVG